MSSSGSVRAAGAAAAAAGGGSLATTQYVNYMDLKLEGVHHLPADWISAGFPVPPAGGPTGGQGNTASSHSHGHGHGKDGAAAAGAGDEASEVAYAYHPFRYEVTLALPAPTVAAVEGDTAAAEQAPAAAHDSATTAAPASPSTGAAAAAAAAVVQPPSDGATPSTPAGPGMSVVAFFHHGRLLQPLPQYTAYVAAAEPPPAPGVDDASPLRDVPVAIGPGEVGNGSVTAMPVKDKATHDGGAGGEGAGGAAGADDAAAATAPSILWVVTERTDAPNAGAAAAEPPAGLVTGKRRVKSFTNAAGASAAATVGANNTAALAAAAAAAAVPLAAPPPLPESSEPAPCVVRVPLTAAQEAYLDGLLESGEPLKLIFRRVLRFGCPAEWEDANAGYFEAEIPISLHALTEPGSTHLAASVPLQPAGPMERRVVAATGGAVAVPVPPDSEIAERGKKRSVTRKQRQLVPSTLIETPDRDAPHPYVTAGTTATVSLTMQRTLTRLVSDRVRPAVTPAQLIPPRPTPTVSAAAATDVQTSLQQTLRGIVQRLVQDMRGSAKGTSGGADGAAWRADFVSALQSTGELAAFKAQLTPLVTGLVQERLRGDPAAAGSPHEVARASNELYVQLMDMLHSTLHECVGGAVAATHGSAARGNSAGAAAGDEGPELRWRAMEAELSGDTALAAKLYHSRLATHVATGGWAALWVDCGLFYQRTEELAKAEQCYREAIACDPSCTPALLDYGAWLLAHDRLDEAAVFLHGLVDVAPQHQLGWGCIALLADLHELAIRPDSPDAAAERKKWRREQRLALRKAAESSPSPAAAHGDTPPAHANSTTAAPPASSQTPHDAEEELMYHDVATYLVNLHHRDLANVCLARCRPGEPRVELLYARLFTQGGQHEEALKTLDGVQLPSGPYAGLSPAEQRLVDECALLRAECAAALGKPGDAVRLYKQALCRGEPAAVAPYLSALAAQWQAQRAAAGEDSAVAAAASAQALLQSRTTEADGMHYLSAYLRLGNLLLADGRYRDALGALTLALQAWPGSSVLWLGAGIAYYRAGDLVPAEECLQESNTLNPANPRTWAYLALLAARLQNVGVEEVVHQLLSLNLEDAALWAELGRTLLGTAQFPRLSMLCLRRAAALADDKGAAADAVRSSTLYHLAHALMDLQQWDEAEQLLGSVAAQPGGNEVLRGKAEEELALLRGG